MIKEGVVDDKENYSTNTTTVVKSKPEALDLGKINATKLKKDLSEKALKI